MRWERIDEVEEKGRRREKTDDFANIKGTDLFRISTRPVQRYHGNTSFIIRITSQ